MLTACRFSFSGGAASAEPCARLRREASVLAFVVGKDGSPRLYNERLDNKEKHIKPLEGKIQEMGEKIKQIEAKLQAK